MAKQPIKTHTSGGSKASKGTSRSSGSMRSTLSPHTSSSSSRSSVKTSPSSGSKAVHKRSVSWGSKQPLDSSGWDKRDKGEGMPSSSPIYRRRGCLSGMVLGLLSTLGYFVWKWLAG